MIAAINVIFLLLLFFMVAGSFYEGLAKEILPPQSASTAMLAPAVDEFLLIPDGGLQLEGRAMTIATWRARLSSEGAPIPAVVRLRVDAGTPAGRVVPLLDGFREAGVARVGLVTVRAQDGRAVQAR